MKVLIIGGGGREHALAWKLSQSPQVTKIYCAPGNPGIAPVAECVPIPATEIFELTKFAVENKIDLTVVGPEDPLVAGIADKFAEKGLRLFGPNKKCAQLEGSKEYAKQICLRNSIPTPRYRSFHDHFEMAEQYLRGHPLPVVVKADGLAGGKGVSICKTTEEAVEAADRMLRQRVFGAAGSRLVVEDFVKGQEVSLMAISDGHTIIPLEPAQDHKALNDGDKGPNTGGMGTYSPLPQLPRTLVAEMEREIIVQTVHAMNREGELYRGCLFAGLMITADGPRVLEFNVRFGDPETQTLMRRMKSDLFPLLWHACDGTLDQCEIEWDTRHCVTVILAAGGYPGKLHGPARINGLDTKFHDHTMVFHGGTKFENGAWWTNGGRVLAVSSMGDTLEEARKRAYSACRKIEFAGKQLRLDVGHRGLDKKSWAPVAARLVPGAEELPA